MKRRFEERELEAGTIDTLNEPIVTVDTEVKRAVSDAILGQAIKLDIRNADRDATNNESVPTITVSADDLANSVFGRKPQALQSEEDVLTRGSMGYLDA